MNHLVEIRETGTSILALTSIKNQEPLEELLMEHGALMFRGFAVTNTMDFSRLFEHYPETGFGYRGGAATKAASAPSHCEPLAS